MMINYGEALREQRIAKGKTLLDVERETGISNANLSRWECGKNLPNIDFCVQLADYYQVTLDELIGREQNENKKIQISQSFNNNTGNINFRG